MIFTVNGRSSHLGDKLLVALVSHDVDTVRPRDIELRVPVEVDQVHPIRVRGDGERVTPLGRNLTKREEHSIARRKAKIREGLAKNRRGLGQGVCMIACV